MNWYQDQIVKWTKITEALKEACTEETHEEIQRLIEEENFDIEKINCTLDKN